MIKRTMKRKALSEEDDELFFIDSFRLNLFTLQVFAFYVEITKVEL